MPNPVSRNRFLLPHCRQSGRLLEVPILAALTFIGLAILIPIAPTLGLTLAGILALAVVGVALKRFARNRRTRAVCQAMLERTATEHGLALGLRLEGKASLGGHVVGLDEPRGVLVFADSQGGTAVPFDLVRAVSASAARRLGDTSPSWYSIDFRIEGTDVQPWVPTTSRRTLKRWLDALAGRLGQVVDTTLPT